jgi:eukaryotic-like serine/threonine-protein kinase
MSLEIGQLIEGKYRIVRLIGEGGMGAVYEGENVRINRRVAIKVLHAGYTENKEVLQRFEREAQAAGRIGNEHILEVLDLGELPNKDHYIVMELLDGEPLSGRIKRLTRMTPFDLGPLTRQMLEGLKAAHDAGIYHRDLKPDNIFILRQRGGRPDFVKIIDFGISKFQPLSGDGMKMTRTGAVMGTPYYMSPEQASGSQEADHRSDLYSIGVIMFEAVTGQVPFEAATFNQLMFKIVLSDVPRPEAYVPDLDPAFASLISKAMARDVSQRFQTAQDFMDAIDAWLKSGTAVTVPPTADPAAAALLPAGARVSAATLQQLGGQAHGTRGNFSTSQVEAVPLKKSNGALIGAVVGGVILLGGGLSFALLGGKKTEAETAPVVAEPKVPSVEVPKAAAPAAPVIEPVAPTSAAAPSASVPPVADAPATAAAKTAAVRAPSRGPSRPATKAPAPASTPPKPAAPKSPATPDFGY